jgi:hypothetical protein
MANSKKKCKHCKKFFPAADMVKVPAGTFCTFDHAIEFANNNKSKGRAEIKKHQFNEMKERVNSQGAKSKLMQRAQASFNAYIRARDEKQPCISCGTTKPVSGGYTGAGGWDAGHYRSRGACPELKFEEDNCFKQCVACNRDNSGNVVNMRIGILKRIGQERLDWIEGPHDPKKYTADDLKEIDKKYKAKLKALQSK